MAIPHIYKYLNFNKSGGATEQQIDCSRDSLPWSCYSACATIPYFLLFLININYNRKDTSAAYLGSGTQRVAQFHLIMPLSKHIEACLDLCYIF